jgi:hypothetical protein
MRLDGADKADKCVDGTFGAFLTLLQCGVYDAVSYGVYSLQGLMRLDRCFMAGSNVAQCHMYSDSAATDTEFTGGATCLVIASGGNRLVNIWANAGTEACIAIQPLNNSTPSINNSIVNLYAGEVFGTNKPVIKIVGTSSNLVQQTHITNCFIVTAITVANKVDGGIYIQYATDVSISNVQFRGQGLAGTTTAYTPYAVYAADNVDGLTLSNCTFRDINRNPVYLNTNIGSATITGCVFQDWDLDENATGAAASAIRIVTGRVTASGNNFYIGGGQTQPYVLDVVNANMIMFDHNYMVLPTPTLTAGTGTVSGFNKYDIVGGYTGKNLSITGSALTDTSLNLTTGSFGSAGSGVAETFNLTTLSNTNTQKVYVVTLSQQGSNSNTAMYYVNVYGSSASAIRISGDTTTPGVNGLTIQMSGLIVQAVIGSAFGAVTWRWNINKLV